jgi:uncharacterized protein YoxC
MADKESKDDKKPESKNKKEGCKQIKFGKFHEYVQFEDQVKELHDLTEKEKNLLVQDFKKLKKIEKEEEAELKALKHFEKRLQDLIENVVYLEGYVQQIEEGNAMLKVNTSVKELGERLTRNMEEVEELAGSILDEEKKIMGLAKHIKQVLGKAKNFQKVIFG